MIFDHVKVKIQARPRSVEILQDTLALDRYPCATIPFMSEAVLPSQEQVIEALKVVRDPEIPVNVVDLGLVYEVDVKEGGTVDITMTLTSIGCPAQDIVKADAEIAVMRLEGVNAVNVDFVWSPPWSPAKMTEDGKRQMRMFGFNV